MTTVASRFSSIDPFLFVVGQFTYDPSRVQRWNTYMFKIERAISSSLSHMLRKCSSPDWSILAKSIDGLPFVTKSRPGVVHCRLDGIDVIYEYRILQGTYSHSLTFEEVAANQLDPNLFEVCYPAATPITEIPNYGLNS